jgi:hypothetical protein
MLSRKISPVWVVMMILSGILISGCTDTPCVDNDGDGYGNPASSLCTYLDPDCDDTNADVNPGVTEGWAGDPTCSDGLDNDCDGNVDLDDPGCVPCEDNDEDGYGDPASESCTYPGLDCDDSDADVNPGATEICDNTVDDDCDGLADGNDPACGGTGLLPDTGQGVCYNNSDAITCPSLGTSLYGQDAQHDGNQPSYQDNGDGTVTDLNTGLMWQQSPDTDGDGDIDAADKMSYNAAVARAATFTLGGYTDWRLPTIKELYSLIDFSGSDPSGYESTDTSGLIPFIDTAYFDFAYGDTSAGERIIDSQYASSNLYVANTATNRMLFGVNFADGRIKGYGLTLFGLDKTFLVSYVRGDTGYGQNDLADNGDGTVTDSATDLMWSQEDSGSGLHLEEALAWVEERNTENYLGYSDWRLPNAKELQSIVDYTRSPDTTGSAAMDALFYATAIVNEAGQTDYPCYWSSTTHVNWTGTPGAYGVYVAFGRAMGYMNGTWVDVHGAGAQRSDPKYGDPDDYPYGHGPQGDTIRIYNYVRLVRDADL